MDILHRRVIGTLGRHIPERVTRQLCAGEFGALQLGWFLPLNMLEPTTAFSETEPPEIKNTVAMSAALVALYRALCITRPTEELASFSNVMALPGYWHSFATFAGVQRAMSMVFHKMQTACASYLDIGPQPRWMEDDRLQHEIFTLLSLHFSRPTAARAPQLNSRPAPMRKRPAESSATAPVAKQVTSTDRSSRHLQCKFGADCNRTACRYPHSSKGEGPTQQ